MTTPLAPRKVGLVLCLVGVAVFLLAGWGLWRDVEWLAQPFYAYAWWSYILFLDGFCVLRRGHSLLTTRRRFVFSLCLWSTSFWFFFELLNLRFQNWYYVGVFRVTSLVGFVGGGVFAVVCFSTVFVGLFETYEALTATGLWRSRGERRSSRVLPRPVSYAVQAFGVAMALSAILFPYYLAPLIWGSFTFLVDPWNYRRGHRSLLRDIEARDWGLVARLFLAGLVCGLVWESCNFFAPQKWIYTVRGLEGLKLFEMPLLGFLGFPGLAYDSVAAFALLSSFFLGGATWEHPGDLAYSIERRPAAPRRVFWGAACLQPVFWLVVSLLMVDVNVGSVEVELRELSVLRPREIETLAEAGVRRPRQLLRRLRDVEAGAALRRRLGWSDERLAAVARQAELFTFKGIGGSLGLLLERVGVRRVRDLARWDEEELHSRLLAELRGVRHSLRLDMVRVWVLASRDHG